MFEEGQKVYTITDSLEKDIGLELYEAEVIKNVENFIPLIDFGGKIGRGYFPAVVFYATPKEALDNAYKNIEEYERKIAEIRQDLIRIEAELKLKEKEEQQ